MTQPNDASTWETSWDIALTEQFELAQEFLRKSLAIGDEGYAHVAQTHATLALTAALRLLASRWVSFP